MASFYKAATAVCLATLCGLQPASSDITTKYKYTPVEVDDSGYQAANLARNGKLPVRINTVTKDGDLVNTLNTTVKGSGTATKDSCDELLEANLKAVFHETFTNSSTPNYLQVLQDALTSGLAVFGKTYPANQQAWEKIWQNDAGGSLAYLLGANSTSIGCVVGRCTKVATDSASDPPNQQTETPMDTGVLFCQLKPPVASPDAAFSEEYFNGLVARTTKLTEMTADDLKPPVTGAAAAAVPTILITGLVAMLAAISA